MLSGFFRKKRRRTRCCLQHRVRLPCLGALPLLYPAAPPSVFDYCIVKYTAPAVALGREYVVGFLGDIFGGDYGLGIFLDVRLRVALLTPHSIRGLSFWHCLWVWQSTCRAAFNSYSICLGLCPYSTLWLRLPYLPIS